MNVLNYVPNEFSLQPTPQTMYSTQDFYATQMRQQVYDRTRYDEYQTTGAQYDDQYSIPTQMTYATTPAVQYVTPYTQQQQQQYQQDLYSTPSKYHTIGRYQQQAQQAQLVDAGLERILRENKEAWVAYTSGKFNVETELVDGIKKIILREKGKIKGKKRGTETKDDYNIKVIAHIEQLNMNESGNETSEDDGVALLKRSTSSMTIKPQMDSIDPMLMRRRSKSVDLLATATNTPQQQQRASYVPYQATTVAAPPMYTTQYPYDYSTPYYQTQYAVDPYTGMYQTHVQQDPATMFYHQQAVPVQRKSRKNHAHRSRKCEEVAVQTTQENQVASRKQSSSKDELLNVSDKKEKNTKLKRQSDIYNTVNSYYANQLNMYAKQQLQPANAQFYPQAQFMHPSYAIDAYQQFYQPQTPTAQFYPTQVTSATNPQFYPHIDSTTYNKKSSHQHAANKYRHQKSTKKFADVQQHQSAEADQQQQQRKQMEDEIKALEDKKQPLESEQGSKDQQQQQQQATNTNEDDKSAFAEYTQEETKKLIRSEKISAKQLEEQFKQEEAKYGVHGRIPIVRLTNLFTKLKLNIPVEEFNPAAAFVGVSDYISLRRLIEILTILGRVESRSRNGANYATPEDAEVNRLMQVFAHLKYLASFSLD